MHHGDKIFYALLVCGALLPLAAQAVAGKKPSPLVMGYFPSWEKDLKPSKINYRLFTHIVHAFISADAYGDILTRRNIPSTELTSSAHAAGVKVLLSLGGQGSGRYFNPMSRDPRAVQRYIRTVLDIMIEYKYDGLDLDWEAPHTPEDHANFVAFTCQLKKAMVQRAPHAVLALALDASSWERRAFHDTALIASVDLVNLMAYDRHGPWSKHAGFLAPLFHDPEDLKDGEKNSAAFLVSRWLANGWPREKLLLGIPCYARGFAVEHWYEPLQGRPPHEELGYREVVQLLKEGWTRHWNDNAKVPWLSKEGEKELISYDDPESAALKAEWARRVGLRGIFFWEITQDMVDGKNAIITAARKNFLK